MGLIKGIYNLGGGFNIGSTGPIDSRIRVENESDLTDSTVWTSSTPVYKGLITFVMSTGDIWKCIDETKYTSLSEGWKKVGSGSDIFISGDDLNSSDTNKIYYTANSKVTPNITTGFGANYSESQSFYNTTTQEGELIFDGNITSISASAFSGLTNITIVTIPDSIKSIGDYAFYNASNLAYVEYKNITYDNRVNLTQVLNNNDVTTGTNPFYGTKLKEGGGGSSGS